MNNLSALNQTKTMSSLEIAELTGKRHDHVIRDIKSILEEAGIDAPKFGGTYKSSQNKELPCFNLPRRECDLVIAGYSVKYRLAIIDRWQELEAQQQQTQLNPANLSRLQLLEMAIQSEQERLVLEETVKQMQPTVEAYDRIATNSHGSMCITDAAKVLQMQPKMLFTWMSANQWIYRRAGGKGWVAYQDRIQYGLLEHKITTVERSDGTEKVVEQVLVLPKGLARLSAAAILTKNLKTEVILVKQGDLS